MKKLLTILSLFLALESYEQELIISSSLSNNSIILNTPRVAYKPANGQMVGLGTDIGVKNTTGGDWVIIGWLAGQWQKTAVDNTLIGLANSQFDSSGSYNTSVGNITTQYSNGWWNAAFGNNVATNNKFGERNAWGGGQNAFASISDSLCASWGFQGLYSGMDLTRVASSGALNLYNMKHGTNVTSAGFGTGKHLINGYGVTLIGADTDTKDSTVHNAMALGTGAVVLADNTIMIGNKDVTNTYINGKFSYTVRPKLDIGDSLAVYSKVQVDSLFSILRINVRQLKIAQYNYKKPVNHKKPVTSKIKKTPIKQR